MRRLIRHIMIGLAAGAIFAAGLAAFCLVDLARTGSGNYPDRLLFVEGAGAELMGEEIFLPQLPPQAQAAASAATALIPPEWRLLFKTALRAVREELGVPENDAAAVAVGAGAEAEIETEAEANVKAEAQSKAGTAGAG